MNEITLDINKSGQIINEPVVLRVGEKDQTITVKLLKDGQAYTNFSTATFNANKQNGSIIANDPADISNGVITYSVPQKLVNEFGKITNAYFLIDGKTTTESFVIAVLKGVNLSSDDLNDYIPGMGELDAIYDKWKAKLQKISDELTGIDAPAEVKNVVNDVLKDYVNQLNDLRNKLITLRSDIDSLSIPEFSTRNLINNSKTLDGLVDSKNITLNGFYDCNVATTTYTNEFPTENYYNLLTAYPTVKVHKGNYTISFVAWADNEGDMISNYFFSSETNTDSGITSQGKKTGAGDGSAEITLSVSAKRYWIKWYNATEGDNKKQIILGRVIDKFSNGHTNKGAVHIAQPVFVEGNQPLPYVPAPEEKVNVSDTNNWQKQKIFQDKICYYANCSAEIDFGDFLKSDKVPIGFSIIRDDSSWMYWRILKENSKNIYGTAQDGNGKSYHLEVFNGLYNGYKSIMNDFTGRTITATDADGKTVKLKVTGIS